MKKQIAVMMAAATAVTTVAPVIAHADTYHNTSLKSIMDNVRTKLGQYYKDNGNGITTGDVAKDSFQNSRYAVLVKGFDTTNTKVNEALKTSGFKVLKDSVYKDANFELHKGTWYVVDDATKLETLIESVMEINNNMANEIQVAIVDKGAAKDDKSYIETTDQYLTVGLSKEDVSGKSETLNTLTQQFANLGFRKDYEGDKTKFKPSLVKELKVYFKGSNDKDVKVKTIDEYNSKIKNELSSKEVVKLEVVTDADTITFVENSFVPDFSRAIAGANHIDLRKDTNSQGILDDVTGFEKLPFTDKNAAPVKIALVADYDVDYYQIGNVLDATVNMGTIYTHKDGYTKEGAEFINGLITASNNGGKFNFRGVNYIVMHGTKMSIKDTIQGAARDAKIEKMADGSYEVKISLMVQDANDKAIQRQIQFVFNAKTQDDVNDVLRDLRQFNEVVTGKFAKLAGSNRYETAVKVSKEQFGIHKADSIVIVGGEAVFDGLAAAPLASSVNAPILLAHPKRGLDKATMEEIGRACDKLNHKTVYIVGGENSVPRSVEKQLKDEYGVVIKRLAGLTRTQTSEQVARNLIENNKANKRVFFVGYDGAADAMSISGVAAYGYNVSKDGDENKDQYANGVTENYKGQHVIGEKAYSPIVVVNKNRISKEARDILSNIGEKYSISNSATNNETLRDDKDKDKVVKNTVETPAATRNYAVEAVVLGGTNTISDQAFLDAQIVVGKNHVKRVAGDNRYETNYRIVNEYYTNNANDAAASRPADYEKLQKAVDDAKAAYDKAVEKTKADQKAYDDAKEKLDKFVAGNKANIEALQKAEKDLETAETNAEAANTNVQTASTNATTATAKYSEFVKELGDNKLESITAIENYLNAEKPSASQIEAYKIAKIKLGDANASKLETLFNAKKDADKAKTAAEQAKTAAEQAKNAAEQAKTAAEQALGDKKNEYNTLKTDVTQNEKSLDESKKAEKPLKEALDKAMNDLSNTKSKYSKILVNGAIFASGNNKYLVDAQTAGSFSADKRLPIILTGDKLTSQQLGLLRGNDALLNLQRTNIYQVGGVVSSKVMEEVVNALSL